MDDQTCSCCISAPTYCIIDLEPAMMNTNMQHLYGTGEETFCLIKYGAPASAVWFECFFHVFLPLHCPLVQPLSSGLVGLTCCWGVIIKSGCPAQEREKLTNPTPHNSASKRIRVRHWAQPMTRFKSFTLAHPSSAISIISIIIIIITTALYPGINKNKGISEVGKTHYILVYWVIVLFSEPKPCVFLLGWNWTVSPSMWGRQEHRR